MHHTCPHTQSTHSQPVCRAPAFRGLSAQDLWRAEYLCNSVYLTLDHTVVLYREVKSDAQDHLMLALPGEVVLLPEIKLEMKADDKLLWCLYSFCHEPVQLC